MSQAAVQFPEMNSATAAIEALVAKHENSWNQHDSAEFGSLFTEDADSVNVLGMHSHGRPAIVAEFEQIHRTFMRNSQVKIEKLLLRFVGDRTAIAHIRWAMTGVEKIPGWNVPDVRHGVITSVLVERDGGWRITAFQNTEMTPIKMPE